jgi:hypothetical protein
MTMAKKQEVAPTQAGPPAALLAKMEAHADAGTSKAASDNLVPLVYILQKQSPQVEKRDPRYVESAEPGDVWLRNAPAPIIKGSDGMEFQPCYFAIDWIEWVPRDRGGGFVARHPSDPEHPEKCPVEDAVLQRDHQNPSRIKYVRPNNNEVIQTRNHVGFVLNNGMALPFVIPMQSTGHTISRQWMFDMNSRVMANGRSYPSWAHIYRLRTRPRTNAMGTWFTWDVEWDGWADELQFDRGTVLHEAFATGAQVPEVPEAEATRAEDQQGPM